MLSWEWFQDDKTAHFFIYCLLRCNWEDGNFKGIKVKKGQFVSTIRNMSLESGLSVQQVRTAIKHLKLTQELTQEVTQVNNARFSLISVVNWNLYQDDLTQESTQGLTKKQHKTNTRLTQDQHRYKNNKNNKEEKENKEENCSIELNDDFFESWILNDEGKRDFIDMKQIVTDTEIIYMDRAGNYYRNDFEKGYVLVNE